MKLILVTGESFRQVSQVIRDKLRVKADDRTPFEALQTADWAMKDYKGSSNMTPLYVVFWHEVLALRVRRRVAEGKMPAQDVEIWYIHMDGKKDIVHMDEQGSLIEPWDYDLFRQDYDEYCALKEAQFR